MQQIVLFYKSKFKSSSEGDGGTNYNYYQTARIFLVDSPTWHR